MDWRDHIEFRPDVLGGKPVFKGTRLGVQHVLEKMACGASEPELLRSHPTLDQAKIRAALSLAADSLGLDERISLGEPK